MCLNSTKGERLNLYSLVCDDMIHERSPDLGEWDTGPRELDSDGQWDYWARAEGGAGPGCLDGTVQDCAQCAVE